MNLTSVNVVVRRDASTVPAACAFEHELPVLHQLYGEESVEVGAPAGQRTIEAGGEYERLLRKYGEEAVASVYGLAHSGRLEAVMASAAKAEDAVAPVKTAKGKMSDASV